MKFQVGYSRKVCSPKQYENLSISFQLEADDNDTDWESAYYMCRDFVEDKIEERLKELEIELEIKKDDLKRIPPLR